MKAVSDSFRLWLSLRPTQRVGGVTFCLWGCIFLVILVVSLTTLGTIGSPTFIYIAVLHGALVSRTAMALYLYPGLVPRLPGAVRLGLIQGVVEIVIVAALLTALSAWARSLGMESSRPISDFRLLLMLSLVGWLAVFVALRFNFSDWVKAAVLVVGAVVGGNELEAMDSAILYTLLVVVLPIWFSPPHSSKSKQQACRPSEVPVSKKCFWQKWTEFFNRSLALFPEGAWVWQSFLARTGVSILAVFVALAIVTFLSGEFSRTQYFTMAIVLMPIFQAPLPQEVVFPGLMGASRSQWARRHVFFRARLWCAWGLGLMFAIILFESVGPMIASDPQHGRSSMEPLIGRSFLFLLVFGLFRMIRYSLLDPFHLQYSGKSLGFSSNLLRNLGWPHGNAWALVLGLVAIVAVSAAIIIVMVFLGKVQELLNENHWLKSHIFLVFSGVLAPFAIASWGWSFRLQYRAILKRDLV